MDGKKGVAGVLCFCGGNGKILIVTREMQKHCKPSNYKSFVHFVNTSKILQVGIRIPEGGLQDQLEVVTSG